MAILNFPDTTGQPTDGSFTYEENGVIYVWDGAKWTAGVANNLTDTFVNRDGDTMTGDLTVPSLNGGPLAGMRNVLINGDFRVQQRYQESGEFVCDRWFVRPITAVGGSQRCFIGDVGNGQHVLQIESTNATSHTYASQKIEAQNIRHLTGKQVTFSCRTDFPNPVLGVATYDSSGTVTNTNYNLDTASDGTKFVSFTLPNAQIGETDTSTGVEIVVYVNGATGIPPNGNHSIRNIQLEPGNQPTPFEMRPIGTELALCQRYFQKVGGTAMPIATGFVTGPTTTALHISYKTEMRREPDITSSGTTNDYALYGDGAPRTITQLPKKAIAGTTDAQLQVDGTAFPATGSTAMLRIAGAAGAVNFDAEL